MPDEAEYQARIAGMGWAELSALWEGIAVRNTPGWEAGKAFEYLVLRAFELDGAEVRYPYSARLFETTVEQIDGAIYWAGLSCLVESKDSTEPVNFEPIAKLRSQLQRRPAEAIGIVFSMAGFTSPATFLAQFLSPQTILLWGGDEIEYALSHRSMGQGLRKKYRFCIEEGLPDYNILLTETPWLTSSQKANSTGNS